MKKTNAFILLMLWAAVAACAWFLPPKEQSDAERRPLAQRPAMEGEAILNGSFMEDFEDYSLDQFPLRDTFRTVKSLFHSYVLGQKDNNGIYLSGGYAVQQEYPLDEGSIAHALNRFQALHQKYLTDSKVVMAIVPDKGYYLAQDAGQLAMDYDRFYEAFADGLPWATHVDLRPSLTASSYYHTDTHWRQEALLPAAEAISQALGVSVETDYQMTTLERPFYGVYYGQAALPMEPDTMVLLESELLSQCTVHDFESGMTLSVYDETKLTAKDLYEVFLSGPRSLLTIENPNAGTDRELLIFRDSFGSAIAPLLVKDYAKVTLIDIRYMHMDLLERFLEFKGQDVLLLFSTLVLNNSETIK